MTDYPRSRQLAERVIGPALIAGAGGLALCAILGFLALHEKAPEPHPFTQFFSSYLAGWLFWLGVSLGSLAIMMMHRLTGGAWGLIIRRFGEAAANVLPLLLVLFIPVILGVSQIYPWANHDEIAKDPILQHRYAYENWGMWTIRILIYFAVWMWMAWSLRTLSLAHDDSPTAVRLMSRQRRISAGGIPIYFVLMTLAAIDWIMSREPHWVSTVFGFLICIGQAISGGTFLVMVLWFLHDEPPFKDVVHPDYLNDLGNLLLTFTVLWAYLGLAQFLIIWLGNKQDEITWYIQRTDGGWRWVGGFLIAFHFLVPFFILLQRPLKRKAGRLAVIAAGLFFVHMLDVIFVATPFNHAEPWPVWKWLIAAIMDIAALVGIGGLWLAAFVWILKGKPLLPIGERIPVVPVDHGRGQTTIEGTVA